jgi:hypothetical protein
MQSLTLPARSATVVLLASLAASLGACGTSAGPPPDPPEPPPSFDYPLDDTLRLQHLQIKASHNSYHVAPPDSSLPENHYTHVPLDAQLGDRGVRHLELDLHYDWDSGEFSVYHVPFVDDGTNCPELKQCLSLIKGWSDTHRAHHPITVQLDIKDPVPAAIEDYFDALHSTILTVWPADRILTPDEVQGTYATLAEAVKAEGWPTLGALRGHILFTLYNHGDGFGDAYTRGKTSLAGRMAFARAATSDDPYAAILHFDDPVGGAASIAAAISENMLVRTHADAVMVEPLANDKSRLEAALASGAQFIATDIPGPVDGLEYWVDVPAGTPSRCNPVLAPAQCTSTAVEDPQFVGP